MASERVRLRAILDATIAAVFGLTFSDLCGVLESCDLPTGDLVARNLNPKGFWRIHRDRDPELRQNVLTLVAFQDLESKIREASYNRDDGVHAFFAQNDGEGWLLPETIRLADHGLGHDDRATQPQVVAGRLGPRFYDWQLAQSGEESMLECHLHARNMLGASDYARLLDRVDGQKVRIGRGEDGVIPANLARMFIRPNKVSSHADATAVRAAEAKPVYSSAPSDHPRQMELFTTPQTELFK